MVSSSKESAERAPLKFRCCEQRRTNIAGEDSRTVANLERVAVDKHHSPICSDEQVAMIHVSHDVTLLVNDCEGPGDIGCNVNQEPEICLWKSL